jgi:DNA polymerase I-like protein with 3'-5' exonuclease and polymerase domains
MTHSLPQLTSTGRLTTSQPEFQHLPGTPLALAQQRRMKAALAKGLPQFIDFSSIEIREAAAYQGSLPSKD